MSQNEHEITKTGINDAGSLPQSLRDEAWLPGVSDKVGNDVEADTDNGVGTGARVSDTAAKPAPEVATTSFSKAISAVGVIAAGVIVLLVNLLAARHYQRWDMTEAKLYTLSAATISTLKSLEKPVSVHVLLAPSDPLQGSIKNLLDTYRATSTRLQVSFVDPDRYPAEFIAVQQKYGVEAGRTEDGRLVTDAAVIVASGDRHWFITIDDMIDFGELDEGVTTSRMEQALTGAIRSVISGERRHVCFSYGHGEYSIDDNGPQGLGEFRERLSKNNYDTSTVEASQRSPLKAYEPCDALVIAGPSVAFSPEEADAIDQRLQQGMGGFFLLNPILDTDRRVQVDTGLEKVTARFGIGLAKDFLFELDDDARAPRGSGEVFFPFVQPHATTQGLAGLSMAIASFRVVMLRTRSLDVVQGVGNPVTLLKTSDKAFGMTDFFAWAESGNEPQKGSQDRSGPLAIAMASQLAKPAGSKLDHGARLVVVGSANIVLGNNWRDLALRGNAVFAGNIVSWIAARPPIVDIAAKTTPAATLRITEASLSEISRYVLLFMPTAAALMGVAVYLRRRTRPERDKKQVKTSTKRANSVNARHRREHRNSDDDVSDQRDHDHDTGVRDSSDRCDGDHDDSDHGSGAGDTSNSRDNEAPS